MLPRKPRRTGNRLLDLLPPADCARLLTGAEMVSPPPGRELCRQEGPVPPHVFFPISGLYCVTILMNHGGRVEAAGVGSEGMIGLPAYLGLGRSPFSSVVRVPGELLRAPAETFRREAAAGGALDRVMRRYVAYTLRYASQTAACIARHSVEERVCRWLLKARERAGGDEFRLTHELLAEILGVRRQTVTVTAGLLQRAGLIRYHRGVVRVLDRAGLAGASCECHAVLTALYERVMMN